MAENATIPTLETLLENSSATPEFKAAVSGMKNSGQADGKLISLIGHPPAVKVLRTIQQLLDQFSDWQVSSIRLAGQSGCSNFNGELLVTFENGETKRVDFIWDCAWKAQEVGYKNFWGDPDQQKAAQEFGYQCFQKFDVK